MVLSMSSVRVLCLVTPVSCYICCHLWDWSFFQPVLLAQMAWSIAATPAGDSDGQAAVMWQIDVNSEIERDEDWEKNADRSGVSANVSVRDVDVEDLSWARLYGYRILHPLRPCLSSRILMEVEVEVDTRLRRRGRGGNCGPSGATIGNIHLQRQILMTSLGYPQLQEWHVLVARLDMLGPGGGHAYRSSACY